MLRLLRARVRALWNWQRQDADLDEEIRFHLSEEAEERAAAGLAADEARVAAQRDFGNVTRIREDTREVWGWGWAERLIQDVRYALRAMRRQPGFSAIAVTTLALGIGGTTAIFTVVEALLLRPLPFPDAGRIVAVFATDKNLPYVQSPVVSLVVRAATDPASLTAAVQAGIWAVDKDQPIANLQPLDRVLWESAAAQRLYVLLLSTFAAIALVIACAGIYGLSAYAVVRRTQEMGIRLALGATSRQVLSLVVRQGVLLILAGAAIGIAGSLALTRVMSGFIEDVKRPERSLDLIGITATDASTCVAVLALFAVVALLSTYIPARRAAAIDPTVAFRSE